MIRTAEEMRKVSMDAFLETPGVYELLGDIERKINESAQKGYFGVEIVYSEDQDMLVLQKIRQYLSNKGYTVKLAFDQITSCYEMTIYWIK